jgi:hypothetical protein
VEFGKLAAGFVEKFVVEGGDAPLFFLHLFGAVGVEGLGGGADGGGWDGGFWESFSGSCDKLGSR